MITIVKPTEKIQKIEFRKITAKDKKLIEVRLKYKKILDDFSSYRDLLTKSSGFESGGSSSSYPLYLARMIVLYEENFKEVIEELNDIEGYKKLDLLRKSPDFANYNDKEGGFPNASLNGFRNFLMSDFDIEIQQYDVVFNERLLSMPVEKTGNLIKGPIRKRVKNIQNIKNLYARNLNESQQAKINANWTCEYDPNHKTFISGINRKPYVEAHHLIPMLAQIDFENTIDFADNIVALCPTCHRNIHYGTINEKEKMLKFFFKNRKLKYPNYGIAINLINLKGYYL